MVTGRSENILSGMIEISDYVGRGSTTVLKWIRDRGFPAKKIDGVWESDKSLVEKWRREQISSAA